MRRNIWIIFGLIIIISALAGLIDWPTGPNISIGKYFKEVKVHEGLDLQGGTHLVYELDTSKIDKKDLQNASQSVIDVIEKRINGLGVSEPTIQSAKIGDKQTVIIELPGITDVNEAINLIGKTAQLKFKELDNKPQTIEGGTTIDPSTNTGETFKDTELTGAHLQRAEVQFDKNTGEPQVSLLFDADGAKLFSDITKRNLQKPVAIELDGQIISAPTVQTEIDNGQAVITGKFDIKEAKKLVLELNAGALPVPIKLIQQQNIGATLGSKSVKKSLVAGLIGLILVAIFMIVYYRLPGLIAVAALFIYSLLALAIFKLIPVTLTLAGIAGFILSIGMAVDANILIFERTKEEMAQGKSIGLALEEGFKRAWTSIRDSNISSLITAAILYYGTSGLVRGFAVTLAIGIVISLFTAITVSRTFLRLFVGTKLEKYLKIV
ncbi:MAG: protein translocase subunit SecD [Candidatus Berkelbacteria bacterium]